MIQLLLNMKAAVETARAAGQTELPARQRAGFEAAYTRFLLATSWPFASLSSDNHGLSRY